MHLFSLASHPLPAAAAAAKVGVRYTSLRIPPAYAAVRPSIRPYAFSFLLPCNPRFQQLAGQIDRPTDRLQPVELTPAGRPACQATFSRAAAAAAVQV